MSIYTSILSIFFDTSTSGELWKDVFSPQDLTSHYQWEISDMFLDGVYIGAHYRDIAIKIDAYKYQSHRKYSKEFVDILSKITQKYVPISEIDGDIALVAVPMHWSRYLIRWFNHIDLLVSGLSKNIWIRQISPLRSLFTRRQSKLSKAKRLKNRTEAFVLRELQSLPETIILIDDIVSTGSTANICAKILKEAGVKKVYWVFIASNQ